MKYFKPEEFRCHCGGIPGCKGIVIDPYLGDMLDKARYEAKIPFVINSGYRCPTYNITIGGKSGSAHTKGKAADIKCEDTWQRYAILPAVIKVGFNRIGVAKTFIHVDVDESLPEGVIWVY